MSLVTTSDLICWVERVTLGVDAPRPEASPSPAPELGALFLCERVRCRLTERACALRWNRANRSLDLTVEEAAACTACIGCPDGRARHEAGLGGDGGTVRATTIPSMGPRACARRAERIRAEGLDPVRHDREMLRSVPRPRRREVVNAPVAPYGGRRPPPPPPSGVEGYGWTMSVEDAVASMGRPFTRAEIERVVGCSTNSANTHLTAMVAAGTLQRRGRSATTRYATPEAWAREALRTSSVAGPTGLSGGAAGAPSATVVAPLYGPPEG